MIILKAIEWISQSNSFILRLRDEGNENTFSCVVSALVLLDPDTLQESILSSTGKVYFPWDQIRKENREDWTLHSDRVWQLFLADMLNG